MVRSRSKGPHNLSFLRLSCPLIPHYGPIFITKYLKLPCLAYKNLVFMRVLRLLPYEDSVFVRTVM